VKRIARRESDRDSKKIRKPNPFPPSSLAGKVRKNSFSVVTPVKTGVQEFLK
jgi:hypothetical protein